MYFWKVHSHIHTNALGFFTKNAWQTSPENGVSLIRMERRVGLKVFLGEQGQWFGENNNDDGDKVSIVYDLDGSVTGWMDNVVGRAGSYLIRHANCLIVPSWKRMLCSERDAQVYIQSWRPGNVTLSIASAAYHSHSLRLQGVNREGSC
ncbi:cell surface hyaluronidase-like isoform X1 [Anolis sagrei]|uniref:cell surface hyaluronidase-like isoform X1 n=1 Tax=Anolis sagrei TaxID=38937 RepID=UPI0035226F09